MTAALTPTPLRTPENHFIRLVLQAKGLQVRPATTPAFFADDQVVLPDAFTTYHYLEERYPAPPLLPSCISQRARLRLMLREVLDYWYPHRKPPLNQLDALAEVLARGQYLTGETLSMIDLALLPIAPQGCELWADYAHRALEALHAADPHPAGRCVYLHAH